MIYLRFFYLFISFFSFIQRFEYLVYLLFTIDVISEIAIYLLKKISGTKLRTMKLYKFLVDDWTSRLIRIKKKESMSRRKIFCIINYGLPDMGVQIVIYDKIKPCSDFKLTTRKNVDHPRTRQKKKSWIQAYRYTIDIDLIKRSSILSKDREEKNGPAFEKWLLFLVNRLFSSLMLSDLLVYY